MKSPLQPVLDLGKKSLKKRYAVAAGAALAFHSGVFAHNLHVVQDKEYRDSLLYVVGEDIDSTLNKKWLKVADHRKKLQEVIGEGGRVDLANFHLDTEYIEGRIDEKEREEAQAIMDELTEEFKLKAKDSIQRDVLNEMIDVQGEYSPTRSYLSSILLENKGNCHAREKLMASMVQRIYPELPTQHQTVKVDGTMHTRTLVQIEGVWYRMEKPSLTPLTEEDFRQTVLFQENDYIENYVGKKVKATYVTPEGEAEMVLSDTKPSITDDYLDLKTSIPASKIRNIAGGTSIGTSNATSTSFPIQPDSFEHLVPDLEIISVDEADKLQDLSARGHTVSHNEAQVLELVEKEDYKAALDAYSSVLDEMEAVAKSNPTISALPDLEKMFKEYRDAYAYVKQGDKLGSLCHMMRFFGYMGHIMAAHSKEDIKRLQADLNLQADAMSIVRKFEIFTDIMQKHLDEKESEDDEGGHDTLFFRTEEEVKKEEEEQERKCLEKGIPFDLEAIRLFEKMD